MERPNNSCLDLARLEKVRHIGNKITARCPACAAAGGDRTGNHLGILPNGRYGCAAKAGDAAHRREIFALAGKPSAVKPLTRPTGEWRKQQDLERARIRQQERLAAAAKARREMIAARHAWPLADVWEDSPLRLDSERARYEPRQFIEFLFPPDALVWAGRTTESGQEGKWAHQWKSSREWALSSSNERVGPMTSPAIWNANTTSRSKSNVLIAPYTVLDFDGFDGIAPKTPEQREAHIRASLALIRWLREDLRWNLSAIVYTGSKSVHAWFRAPAQDVLASLTAVANPLGLDAGLIGRPEHPCRLPGHIHEKTGVRSEVLWMKPLNW